MLEEAEDHLVDVRAVRSAESVSQHRFLREAQALGDRLTPPIVGCSVDLDAVQVLLAEAVIDEEPADA